MKRTLAVSSFVFAVTIGLLIRYSRQQAENPIAVLERINTSPSIVDEGDPIVVGFLLSNRSNEDLLLTDLRTSCGCLSLEIDGQNAISYVGKRLQNIETTVLAKWSTKGMSGETGQAFSLFVESSGRKIELTRSVETRVRPNVRILPPHLTIGQDGSITDSIIVYDGDRPNRPLVAHVSVSNPMLKGELVEISDPAEIAKSSRDDLVPRFKYIVQNSNPTERILRTEYVDFELMDGTVVRIPAIPGQL